MAAVLCACDVIQPKSSMRGPWDHPALFSPKNAAPAHHDKLHEAEYFRLAKDVAAIYALLREGMRIKVVDMGMISTQA